VHVFNDCDGYSVLWLLFSLENINEVQGGLVLHMGLYGGEDETRVRYR
jgi:hypothetical protein